jgi:UDP-3-O-[3-hydroxymyristoyl] N-acetylglucosamine deacetylase
LGNKDGDIVSTIEHLMATLSVLKIDNAVVEVSAPEMPILDGAAAMFWQKLSAAGVREQSEKRHYLKVLKKVAFEDGKGASVCLEPAEDFEVHFEIEFPSKIVGHQVFDAAITPDVFVSEIAPCRTFCEKYQIDYLRSIGLIKGGSLENAVVLDGEQILNPGGFKVKNECVNHKVLDAVGDMYTAGLPLLGRLTALKSGHYHNNQLLRALFADKSLYEIV